LQLERGQRTRVRAGPFANRAQAEQAAARIKALGLDAQVFKQGASE
jgi:DedD protein